MADPPNGDARAIEQKGKGDSNRGIADKAETIVYRISGPSVSQTAQTNPETNPEINNLFMALSSMRTKASPEEFHKFMGKNELYLFPKLKPFGYQGSKARAEDTIKDFRNWQKIIRDVSSLPGVQTIQVW